ncbi:MAG TPA: hypothetical protein IAB31_13305 [Candidatus Choladousia intestinavium]|uniref:L-fucose isomerase n=1 Tax=Candidatus Choladousia intestinavium TaxID=2840727 RepID=A0A9D1AEX2_9FIRM|nr:hypothetical protein [Candidatus Choladousia intestinavium]
MKANVYYIASGNKSGDVMNPKNEQFVKELSQKSGVEMSYTSLEELKEGELNLVFIGGGGTEGMFLEVFDKLPSPILLLTTGENNSLAASMEILSFLRQKQVPGEIIHGSLEDMSRRIQILARVFQTRKRIHGLRVGCVGEPSDWLISSGVDGEASKEKNGIEIIKIPMQEMFDEIAKKSYVANEYTKMISDTGYKPEEVEKALEIYGALKRICEKYRLDSVTIRCFDLLGPVGSTGCAALAVLNAEGIYAGCEGDIPSLIAMTVLGELSGQPVFMANPSRILSDKKEIIFAHCTLPITMPLTFRCMTHYESDLGVAFQGDLKEGPVTVFKCSGLLDQYFVAGGELVENLHEANLCRTQLKLRLKEGLDYFTTRSIGNHHLICLGDYTEVVKEFFRWMNA